MTKAFLSPLQIPQTIFMALATSLWQFTASARALCPHTRHVELRNTCTLSTSSQEAPMFPFTHQSPTSSTAEKRRIQKS